MTLADYGQFLIALAIVLALILGLAWAARRFGVLAPAGARPGRLSVTETAVLDAKRRLVLVRRDDREHLLLLGPNSETVIETGIAPTPAAPGPAGEGRRP